MSQIQLESCHVCGCGFENQQLKLLLSDEYKISGYDLGSLKVTWLKKKYCVGDGTLKCADIPTDIRRGAMYEAWLEDPKIIFS